MAAEHSRVRCFYADKDASALDNTPLRDLAIGRLNLIQALRAGADHVEHHSVAIRRIQGDSRSRPNPPYTGR